MEKVVMELVRQIMKLKEEIKELQKFKKDIEELLNK